MSATNTYVQRAMELLPTLAARADQTEAADMLYRRLIGVAEMPEP